MTTPAIRTITFDATTLRVELLDGRTIEQPIERFPRLLHATPEQRRNFRIGFGGTGIHWNDLDEDISVAGLLKEQGQ